MEERTKAYESFQKATLQDPRHEFAWRNLIILLEDLGNTHHSYVF